MVSVPNTASSSTHPSRRRGVRCRRGGRDGQHHPAEPDHAVAPRRGVPHDRVGLEADGDRERDGPRRAQAEGASQPRRRRREQQEVPEHIDEPGERRVVEVADEDVEADVSGLNTPSRYSTE